MTEGPGAKEGTGAWRGGADDDEDDEEEEEGLEFSSSLSS